MNHLASTSASRCIALLTSSLLLVLVVAQTSNNQKCRNPVSCDTSQNYFPADEQVSIKYATKTITEWTYSNVYLDMTVTYSSGTATRRYRFVKCGCSAPAGSDRTIMYIDPNGVYMDDSVSIAMLDALDPQLTALKYVRAIKNKYDQHLRDLFANGTVRESGHNKTNIPSPSFLESPGVSSVIDNPFNIDSFPFNATDAETPGLVVAELEEMTPLARAEWIKVIGLYFNLGKVANNLFASIEFSYNRIKAKAETATRRPSVFFNLPFQMKNLSFPFPERYEWFQPAGNSYIAAYIQDANADFRLANTTSSQSLTVEEVRRNFSSAHFLLNANLAPPYNLSKPPTMTDALNLGKTGAEIDTQFAGFMKNFTAVRCGNVFSMNLRITEDASDFFERGVVRPDLVLADYVKVLHANVDLGGHVFAIAYQYPADGSLNLTCPFTSLVGPAPSGSAYVDKVLEIEGLDRFQVQDRLESDVYPEMRERDLKPETMDYQFVEALPADLREPVTNVTVRQQVKAEEREAAEESFEVRRAFADGLDVEVREVGRDDDGGLGAAAIIGIIFAGIVVLAGLAVGVFLLSKRSTPKDYGDLPPDHDGMPVGV